MTMRNTVPADVSDHARRCRNQKELRHNPPRWANMTEAEAFREAQLRWGRTAGVRCWDASFSPPKQFTVGRYADGTFEVCGAGDSWEHAFQDADARSVPCPTHFS
jgi:hypothetical protein